MAEPEEEDRSRWKPGQSYPPGKHCNAWISKREAWCKMPAGHGTDHTGYGRCKRHFGSTPALTKNALQSEALDVYRRRLGHHIDVNPADAIMALIGEAASNVMFYRSRLEMLDQLEDTGLAKEARAFLDPGSHTIGKIYEATYFESGAKTGLARPHILIEMYNDERDRLAKWCEKAISLGLREREVRVQEQQATALATVVQALLRHPDLALTPEQQRTGRRIAAAELRRLDDAIEVAAYPNT